MKTTSFASRQSVISYKRDTSVIIDNLPEVTGGSIWPSLLLLMETLYMFAVSSLSVYSVYGLGEFISLYRDYKILAMMTEAKFYGCCMVLLVGIMCDSYIGHYYSVLTLLIIATCLPILYFTIAIYPHVYQSETKLVLTDAAIPFWGILLVSEPLRMCVIATSVMERHYFRKPRTFFAVLIYVWYIGIFLGGLTVWMSGPSRISYSVILGIDSIIMSMYVGFWLFSRNTLLTDRGPLAVIERLLAYSLCLVCKKLDKYLFRRRFFKRTHGPKDFRCVTFSDRSVTNARNFLGILLVTLPLTAYLCVLVIMETLYYVQVAMLYFSTELYPLLSLKAALYLIIYPPVEFLQSKYLDKWFCNSVTKQLCLTGIGAFIMSFAVMWTSVVQHEIVKDLDFWMHLKSSLTQVSITNCLETSIMIRGQYYNKLKGIGMDQWVVMEPMRPIFILKIPEAHVPFHLELENSNISLYDEHRLPLAMGTNNWYVIFPDGLRKVHPSCYANVTDISMNPKTFQPATICVMCALAVCNGRITFEGEGFNERFDVSLGGNMEDSMIHTSGKFMVTVRFGEEIVSGKPKEVSFEKLGSYLMIVYDSENRSASLKGHQGPDNFSLYPYEEISALHVIETFPPRRRSVLWMLPAVVLHAVALVFTQVSLLTYLYQVSPSDVRTTVFCMTRSLSFPAYWYLFEKGSLTLQNWMPIYFFSMGCANCFFMIIYFFSTVYYVHMFLVKRSPTRRRRSDTLRTGSDTLRSTEDDTVPDTKER